MGWASPGLEKIKRKSARKSQAQFQLIFFLKEEKWFPLFLFFLVEKERREFSNLWEGHEKYMVEKKTKKEEVERKLGENIERSF